MKKITFLVAALCATMFASAAEVTISTFGGVDGTFTDACTYTSVKGAGQTAPAVNTGQLRIYALNELTLTNLTGVTITSVKVNCQSNKANGLGVYVAVDGGANVATVLAAAPAANVAFDYEFTDLNAATSIKFTEDSKTICSHSVTNQWKINSMTIVYTTGTSTAIDQVTAPLSIYANNGTIYGAENARIYTILGMDVTEQNGNLNGIYVVKANGKTQKIAVK